MKGVLAFVSVFALGCTEKWGDRAGKEGVDKEETAANGEAKNKVPDGVPVETSPTVRGSISAFLSSSSTIETEEMVEIYPQITELIEEILVEEGDAVQKGQPLLHIDDDEALLALRESEVHLKHLEAGFRRVEEMSRMNMINDQEFEDQRFQYDQARLRSERARLELEYTVVTAPFSGIITERFVQVGQRVSTQTRLFQLVNMDQLIARVFVPGQRLSALRIGQPATITTDFLPETSFRGWIKRMSPAVDPESGTLKVTLGLEDSAHQLKPGMFISVEIITDTHEDAVLVPKEAVVYEGGERYVFIVRDETASKVLVDGGLEDSLNVEVLSMIDAGVPVIVRGQSGLKDQSRVRIIKRAGRRASRAADSTLQEG